MNLIFEIGEEVHVKSRYTEWNLGWGVVVEAPPTELDYDDAVHVKFAGASSMAFLPESLTRKSPLELLARAAE